MTLLIWYMGLVAIGDVLAYFPGLWSSANGASTPAWSFSSRMYFLVLWVAWQLSVWITAPKKAAAA